MTVTATPSSATRVVQQEVTEQVVTIVIDRRTASRLCFPLMQVRDLNETGQANLGLLGSEVEAVREFVDALIAAVDK